MKLKKTKTQRGFDLIEFEDIYKGKCSLQKSSLASKDAIWFGIDDADPKIMCSDARKMGLRGWMGGEADNGFCKFEIPKEVLLTTRMHLTRSDVKKLLPILQKFVETGEII